MSNAALTWAMSTRVGSSTRKLVLLVLADRANDDNWSTWVGQETIAVETELSVRSVGRALAEMEHAGVIERSQRRRGDGFRSSDLIRLNMAWEPEDEPPDPVDNPVSPDTESCDRESPDSLSGCSDHDHPTQSHLTDSHPTERHLTLCPTSPDTLSNLTRHSVGAENEPSGEPKEEPSENDASRLATQDQATRLAHLLADSVAQRGSKRPTVTKAWVTDMDRLLRIDAHPPDEVERVINWLTRAPDDVAAFWQPNIRSPRKLRAKWDQMREQHHRQRKPTRAAATAAAADATQRFLNDTPLDVNPLDAIYGRPG